MRAANELAIPHATPWVTSRGVPGMPESPWPTKRAGAVRPLVHYSGFLIAGLLALAADLLILEALILVGLHPLIGRVFAISIAMVVSWLINRTITFAMPGPPSLREYLRFAAVSWTSQAVNYSIFGAILILRPSVSPLLAVVLASVSPVSAAEEVVRAKLVATPTEAVVEMAVAPGWHVNAAASRWARWCASCPSWMPTGMTISRQARNSAAAPCSRSGRNARPC